jgi:hypothetical protein
MATDTTKTVLQPFKTAIAMSKEAIDMALAPLRSRAFRAKADTEISNIESEIFEKQKALQEACFRKDVNFATLVDERDDILLLMRRKEAAEELVQELFPSTDAPAA